MHVADSHWMGVDATRSRMAAPPSSGGAVLVAVARELRVGVDVVIEPDVVGVTVVPGVKVKFTGLTQKSQVDLAV